MLLFIVPCDSEACWVDCFSRKTNFLSLFHSLVLSPSLYCSSKTSQQCFYFTFAIQWAKEVLLWLLLSSHHSWLSAVSGHYKNDILVSVQPAFKTLPSQSLLYTPHSNRRLLCCGGLHGRRAGLLSFCQKSILPFEGFSPWLLLSPTVKWRATSTG